MSLEFVCNNGCGVCKIRLSDFEYERTETMEGELVSSKTHPRIVSACCGFDVDVWDERAQDVTGHVSVEPVETRVVGEPWTEEQMESLRAWAKNSDEEGILRRAEEIKAERAAQEPPGEPSRKEPK